MIPLCDVTKQYQELKSDIDAAIAEVLSAGRYILGPQVKAFEKEMCDYLGCRYAVGVGNGTDALHLALRAAEIGAGDEVITTPFTFIATTEAIQMVGAKPVFVDIDPSTYNIDPELIERAVTSRTKAILPVHLYGRPCDMTAINDIAKRKKVRVIEDCAQSLGAEFDGQQTGTFGDAGCLSFFPSKNLGCMGDGGMIVTNSREIFERAEMLRRHGGKVKYHHTVQGVNSRLDELQAAILRVKLPRLDFWNQQRHDLAARYDSILKFGRELQLPLLSAGKFRSVFHQYTIVLSDRAQLIERLDSQGIGNAVYYPIPLHLQEVNAYLGHREGDFPHAESIAKQCLSLPMSPHLTESQQVQIAASIAETVTRLAG